ncbi:MAG: PBP1A family penicillin-binding protein [Cystobacterineae bacterium]|nr:PBP1A family penicillin-binding protein [Cystobacterineae bacterium]
MPNSSKLLKWLRRFLWALATLCLLLLLTGVGGYFYFSQNLPSVEELRGYKPPQITKVYCEGGELCAEFFSQRRTWVDIRQLPEHVRFSFLAAEDAKFYEHQGINFFSLLRAAVKSFRPNGKWFSGASTISQQACRNLLLSRERKLSRKIRELILTWRMEKTLTKDEILNLYVNTIYFGHQRYGIEEAARFYFGKGAAELSLAEAAVLGGTPQLPHRINPLTSLVRAKKRQRYVLGQLASQGFVDEALAQAAMEEPLLLGPRPAPPVGPYYVEEVRKALIARYGEKTVLEGGLRVELAMKAPVQAMAEAALQEGLRALDRRQGYRGALGYLPLERWQTLHPLLLERLAESGKRHADEFLLLSMEKWAPSAQPSSAEDAWAHEENPLAQPAKPLAHEEVLEAQVAETAEEKLVAQLEVVPLEKNVEVVGIVVEVEDRQQRALVDLVSIKAELQLADALWARPLQANGELGLAPQHMSDIVKPGQLVRVALGEKQANGHVHAVLAQRPLAQAALVAIEAKTRRVVAMVGGQNHALSPFNRATRAQRQPGSAFKPFLYGAAIASEAYTAASIVNDAPEVIRDPWTGKTWKPQNYEKSGFAGPMPLRQALAQSKNTVSVRLMEALGPEAVVDFAMRAGIFSPLQPNLSLALGTSEVNVLELCNAYATLQSNGQFAQPILVVSVKDNSGKLLEAHSASFEERIEAATAFVTTSLMRAVVEEGTAQSLKQLKRPIAGKTGTTQNYKDAWFAGFSAEMVAVVWVGFDEGKSLGHGETGGRTALPMWLAFVQKALHGQPVQEFPKPERVLQERIEPTSGLLAGDAVPGRLEWFIEGTQPTERVAPQGDVEPSQFLMHSQGN